MEQRPEILQTDNEIASRQLDLLRDKLALQSYPGYPLNADRLVANCADLDINQTGNLILPDGPWTVNTHANRPDAENAPSEQQQQALLGQGLELDSAGRPLHPWFKEMVEDPMVGVATGKGAYWKWGPNYTVDSIVFRGGDVLLVKRGDTGNWALPGGFLDDEAPINGAARELKEESGIVIPDGTPAVLAYQGPVVDIRVTANSWPETYAFCFVLDEQNDAQPIGADDAIDAAWVPLHIAQHEGALFGSHRFLLDEAVARQNSLLNLT